MDLIQRIESIIQASLEHRGYNIVRVQINGSHRRQLQIMIENIDQRPITIDDCTEVSRCVSLLLDVEDPISGPYNLEISSAGLDRPLVKPQDYIRFSGEKVQLQTHLPIQNRKKFVGRMHSQDGHKIHLDLDLPLENGEKDIDFQYDAIRHAKLYILN